MRVFTTAQEHEVCHRLRLALARGGIEAVTADEWARIYASARGFQPPKPSNKPFSDLLVPGLGVEFKSMRRLRVLSAFGKSVMHPAITRSLKYDPSASPQEICTCVVTRFNELVREFRNSVETRFGIPAALRWGVLLLSPLHIAYFEEPLNEMELGGWTGCWDKLGDDASVFRMKDADGRLRFSITHPKNAAKIQMYFDVPGQQDVHLFTMDAHHRRAVWLDELDIFALEQRFGSLDDPSNADRFVRTALEAASS